MSAVTASNNMQRHAEAGPSDIDTKASGLRLEPEDREFKDAGTEASYGQILKSSALIGGSSVISIAMGMIRTKAMAMLLGPAGFGLAGLYMSVANLTQSIAGMGVNSSGVREIAEAASSEDRERIARTAAVLRRTSIWLGLVGAVILAGFSRQVSTLTFGDTQHAGAVALLSLVVFFNLVSAGQGALIQGMRHISDLAQMAVLGALYGTVVTIPIVYFLRERGVVPSLAACAALSLVTSWWYSRKVQIPRRPIGITEAAEETSALLKLGFAFMASGLMTLGSAYLVRIIVLHNLGLEATGVYQSAWTLGGMYVGIILQAMGADFYPRLTASAHDNVKCNRLVNEQTRVSLLLAGPGVIATLTFAHIVIALFYSAKFAAAVGILRWICLGATLQAVTWPMGFILIAKGEQAFFFWCEVAWAVVSVGLAWICVRLFGVNGAGMAFCGSYLFHCLLIYPIVQHMSHFRWSSDNLRTGLIYLSVMSAVFCASSFLPGLVGISAGVAALIGTSLYSTRTLVSLVGTAQLPRPLASLFLRFQSSPNAVQP
jgi:PST family polysaccharide transporter